MGLSVCHVTTHDTDGGAARAAYRVHRGQILAGVDSTLLVARRGSADPKVTEVAVSRAPLARFQRRLARKRIRRDHARYRRSLSPDLELFTDDRSEFGADLVRALPPCDVLNLHWISGFVDLGRLLAALPRGQRVVWTLHDMNPLTGGCHFDSGCGKFRAACGACPQLGSDREGDLSRAIFERKQRALAGLATDQLRVVAPSRWLAEEVRHSPLLGRFDVTVIPNGLPLDVFAPGDATVLRRTLGIRADAQVLLFAAHDVGNRRKGLGLLIEALRGMAFGRELHLLSVGAGRVQVDLPVEHTHVGRVEHDGLLALLYSAADLFVLPSLQDNLPNTAIEALACGTPVVGFATGGVVEIVRPGVTGALAPVRDVAALRGAIEDLLADEGGRREMSRHCRRVAVEEYALELQARRYVELYESLTGPRPGARATAAPA